jgi:hypothetical protein
MKLKLLPFTIGYFGMMIVTMTAIHPTIYTYIFNIGGYLIFCGAILWFNRTRHEG